MKEMHVQALSKDSRNRNETTISDFLSSPFSPIMTNILLAAGENISLTLDKRESFESKLLKAFSEKIHSLQKIASLLNMCRDKKNQG